MWKFKTAALGALLAINLYAVEIDQEKSVVNWKGTKVTGQHVGTLKFKSGNAEIEGDKLVGGNFTVDLNSLDVTDLEGDWKKKFTGHMMSADFFNTEKYPESKLVIKKVKGNKVTADLTIKDKTHPVTFTYKKQDGAFVGDFTFDRTKYGMIYNSGNFFKDLGDKLVHNDVLVQYKIVPKKK